MAVKNSLNIPFPFCKLFEQYECFNEMQSSILDDMLNTDKSFVLSAPTGAGKTVAFELAVVRLVLQKGQTAGESQQKAVYVAPTKALCSEKYREWSSRFQPLGVSCIEVTGDSDLSDLRNLRSTKLIITTPEKWEVLTRASGESELIADVQLFMIDEVHLLNEDVRGPVLEVIVTRMKLSRIAIEGIRTPIRFILASATIPNIEDLITWIGGSEEVAHLTYNEMQRPVPLQMHVIGINSKLIGFKFDMSLNYKLSWIINKYSQGKATLIFCNSRKSAEMAATVIDEGKELNLLSDEKRDQLLKVSQSVSDVRLSKFITHGIAFHHAGLAGNDRSIVEEAFRNGWIMVLLCTNTLAMGVNLPAHLVIIKSTESCICGSLKEYPESTILQMIGRAGRPRYDSMGISVILTQSNNVRKYEHLIHGKVPIESNLHKHLAEHLNSEITLKTIRNLSMVMDWLRSTYLYVRALRNPAHYGLLDNANKDTVENHFQKISVIQINELFGLGLINRDFRDDINLHPTGLGKIMAKFCITFETMKLFRGIRGTESFLELLKLISSCKEFSGFSLRVNEKQQLNELNKAIRFPIEGRIKIPADKILCLIQAIFGSLQISSSGLAQEAQKIIRIGTRLSMCLAESVCFLEEQQSVWKYGCYKAVLNSVTLSKCFHAKLWEHSEHAPEQLEKNYAVCSSATTTADGKAELSSIPQTKVPNTSFANPFPQYLLQIKAAANSFSIYLKQTNRNYKLYAPSAVLIVGDCCNNLLLFNREIDQNLMHCGFFEQTITLQNMEAETIFAHVVHAKLVGVDTKDSIKIHESNNHQDFDRDQNGDIEMPTKKESSIRNLIDPTFAIKSGTSNVKRFSYSKPKLKANTWSNGTAGIAQKNQLVSKTKLKSALVQTELTSYFKKTAKTIPITKSILDAVFTTALDIHGEIGKETGILEWPEHSKKTSSTSITSNWISCESDYKDSTTNVHLKDETDAINSVISISSSEPLDLRIPKERTVDLTKKYNKVDYKDVNLDAGRIIASESRTMRISGNKIKKISKQSFSFAGTTTSSSSTCPKYIFAETTVFKTSNIEKNAIKGQQFRRLEIKNETLLQDTDNKKCNKRQSDDNVRLSEGTANRNPFRLQIYNEIPEISADTDSSGSSRVQRLNNHIMNYILNQKCTNLNESYGWRSIESLLLSKSDEGPLLTAEEYKLIFG